MENNNLYEIVVIERKTYTVDFGENVDEEEAVERFTSRSYEECHDMEDSEIIEIESIISV